MMTSPSKALGFQESFEKSFKESTSYDYRKLLCVNFNESFLEHDSLFLALSTATPSREVIRLGKRQRIGI